MREGKTAYRKDGMVLPTQGEEDSRDLGRLDLNRDYWSIVGEVAHWLKEVEGVLANAAGSHDGPWGVS